MEEKLQEIKEEIKKNEKNLKKIQKNLNGILDLIKKSGSVYKMEPFINSIESILEKTNLDKDKILKMMGELKREVRDLKEDFRFEISRGLEKEFKKIGMELRGHLPTLHAGFYRIAVDFTRGKADLLFGPDKVAQSALSPEEITKVIKTFGEGLKKNAIKEEDFLGRLFSVWQRVSLILSKERVPLTTILAYIAILFQENRFYENPSKRNYKEYPRYQFAYDLYRLQRKETKKVRGKELHLIASTFDATRRKIDYVWIPTNEKGDGINYSYLIFR